MKHSDKIKKQLKEMMTMLVAIVVGLILMYPFTIAIRMYIIAGGH